ncbi:MAG: glycosyltransferase [Thermoleophilaceae bacterium]
MKRRGHQVVWPANGDGKAELRRLARCDLVHVYRRCDEETRRVVAELARGGIAITWDNDDDFTAVPKESANYRKLGGLAGQRIFTKMVKVARRARLMTTTSELIAAKYRRAGIERVEVIGNHVPHGTFRPRRRHDGVVIGWVAALEHRADIAHIPLVDALRRLLAERQDVRVETVGVDLGLPAERYHRVPRTGFRELPKLMGAWDIGIAPLADLRHNRARSDIKLKEYAASGLPWLASPLGPYIGLGEDQGGLLVADDGWFEALSRLAGHRGERRRLARRAKDWAKHQTIDTAADRWERLFAEAAGGRGPDQRS